jgi:hypothetical protein
MALLPSEVDRIRFECGYNVLDVGAEPYIGVSAMFDQVIAAYLRDGATTTSSTAVLAASAPTAVVLTLASAVGFAAGARVIVDVDSAQETATVRSVSGSTITVLLQLAHPAGYPVSVEGGESIVRAILRKLDAVNDQLGAATSGAGLKRVDEVEWYAESGSSRAAAGGRLATLQSMRDFWRDELCSALGVSNAWRMRGNASQTVSLY